MVREHFPIKTAMLRIFKPTPFLCCSQITYAPTEKAVYGSFSNHYLQVFLHTNTSSSVHISSDSICLTTLCGIIIFIIIRETMLTEADCSNTSCDSHPVIPTLPFSLLILGKSFQGHPSSSSCIFFK